LDQVKPDTADYSPPLTVTILGQILPSFAEAVELSFILVEHRPKPMN